MPCCLPDFRTQLSATDYGNFLANQPMPISTSTISEKATQILVDQFNYIKTNSVQPLASFLDYITCVVLTVIESECRRQTQILVHDWQYNTPHHWHTAWARYTRASRTLSPSRRLWFHARALCCNQCRRTVSHCHRGNTTRSVIHPVQPATLILIRFYFISAPYFRDCLSATDLDDLNIEIIRNTVYKAYLEDFYNFVTTLGEPTTSVMHKILSFEADRRTINITINSFNTELTKEQRARLFPTIGRLWPAGNNTLARADEIDQVRQACDTVADYRPFLTGSSSVGDHSDDLSIASQLEDRFFQTEVQYNKEAFLQQFQYGVFYAYMKLKEQEIRNLTWIAECIAQDAKDRIQDFIPIFWILLFCLLV